MERKPEQISRDIAAFERKLSEAGDNQVLKEALTKRIKKLKDELKGLRERLVRSLFLFIIYCDCYVDNHVVYREILCC